MSRIFEYLEAATTALKMHSIDDAVKLRNRAIFEVLYSTGMRREELQNLTSGAIDFENGVVLVNGKGGKDRVVPIGAKSMEAVNRYIHESRPLLAAPECRFLFVSRRGGRLGNNTIREAVIAVTRAAGIQRHIKVHTIRHTCATHMLNNGADIRYVQEMLGHENLSSTQIYTHVSIVKLKETYAKFHPREKQESSES